MCDEVVIRRRTARDLRLVAGQRGTERVGGVWVTTGMYGTIAHVKIHVWVV